MLERIPLLQRYPMMPINPGPNLSRKRTRKQVLAGEKQHKSSLYLRYLIYFHRKIDCLKCASVFISVLIKNLKNIHTRNGFIDEYDEYDQQASSAGGQQFSFELETGGNLSFTLKREGRPLRAATVPTFGGAPLGNMGYKGIGGKPVLYTVEHKTTSTLKFSDIRVTDRLNNPVPNFHFVAIDGESTGPI